MIESISYYCGENMTPTATTVQEIVYRK
jgi:hypothetical protein